MEEQTKEQTAQEIPKISLKIGELYIECPILLDNKHGLELIDKLIEKIKTKILEDKTFKQYLSFVKVKGGASYTG